jgi:hypothetical protein
METRGIYIVLMFGLVVLPGGIDAFAETETKGFRITQEEAILIAKAEAMRLKYADSIEEITSVKVVVDPNKHDWNRDKAFNGQGYYKNSKLKHKKYWELFFDACCAIGNHGLIFIDATSGVILEVHGGA